MKSQALNTLFASTMMIFAACDPGMIDEGYENITDEETISTGAQALNTATSTWSDECWGTGYPYACNCYERAGNPSKACPVGAYCTPNFSCENRRYNGQLCVVKPPILQSDPSCVAGYYCAADASINPQATGGYNGICRPLTFNPIFVYMKPIRVYP